MLIAAKLLFLTLLASSLGNEIDADTIAADYLEDSEDTSITSLLLALLGKIRDLEDEVNTLKLNDADQSLKLATLPYIENDIEDLKQNDDKQDLSLSVFDRTLTNIEAQTNEQESEISALQTDISSLLDKSIKQDFEIETLNSTVINLESSDNKQDLEIIDLASSLTQLQLNNGEIEKALLDLAEEESCAGVIYNDSCIRLLYIVGNEAGTWHNAASMCEFHGGRLAEIETNGLFYQVYDYIKKSWNVYKNQNRDYVAVLLGMKYMNGELIFTSSGNSIPADSLGFWRKGFPISGSDDIYMRLMVPSNRPSSPQLVESGEQGFYNLDAAATTAVPLCQFSL